MVQLINTAWNRNVEILAAKPNSHNIRDHRSARTCRAQLSGTISRSLAGVNLLGAAYASDVCQFCDSWMRVQNRSSFVTACNFSQLI
jgi:hypothetical protein